LAWEDHTVSIGGGVVTNPVTFSMDQVLHADSRIARDTRVCR
jgi:hypothetical protein